METKIMKLEAPELSVIEPSKAEQIRSTFAPMADMLAEFENAYNEVIAESKKEITTEVTSKAKRLRIDIGKVRIETGKIKDDQKAEYLRAGKAIQGVHNLLVWAVTDKEEKLKEIENHFLIQEQKRLEALQLDRAEKLSKYIEDAEYRDLSKLQDDEFEALLSMKKKEHEDRIAAEKKADEDRIAKEKADEEERQRMMKENERLKREADKRAKENAARLAKEEAERKAREAKAKKEREAHEAELKAAREAQEEAERKAKAERDALEAKLKAKEEAERKAKEAEEQRVQAELNKGDADKVQDLISNLTALKTKYSFQSKKNNKMYSDVGLLIDKVINHIQAK